MKGDRFWILSDHKAQIYNTMAVAREYLTLLKPTQLTCANIRRNSEELANGSGVPKACVLSVTSLRQSNNKTHDLMIVLTRGRFSINRVNA